MSDINWAGLNRGPNIFGELADGYQRGNDVRRQNQRDNLYAERQAFEISQAKRQQALEDEQRQRKVKVGTAVASGDFRGARTAAEGDFDLLTSIGKLDEDQRKRAHETADDLAGFATALKVQPYEARKGIIAQAHDTLTSYGFTPEQIAAFDPSDQALDGQVAAAMDLKTALEEQNRQRDDKRAAELAKETQRHNGVVEGQGAARVGIAADANRRAWAAHKERKKAGGYGTPGVSGSGSINPNEVDWD